MKLRIRTLRTLSLDLGTLMLVILAMVLGILGKVDWWIVCLFLLSTIHVKLKFGV